jgi:hypothetical protein
MAARNGWNVGGGSWDDHDDEPVTQALPIRNGNSHGHAAGPSNGSPAGDGPDQPSRDQASRDQASRDQADREQANPAGPATPPGPSRLPAFTGLSSQGPQAPQFPIGSQNIYGSDGPSASDQASAANGLPVGANRPGSDDSANDSGQVTIPPATVHEQRLPIFDSLESDWFRRSGQTMTTGATTTAATTTRAPAAPPAEQGFRTSSAADEGWRAAEVAASPAAGEKTQAGLPRRVPRANLVPGSVGGGGQEAEAEAPVRSPDAIRSRMASFQRGVREGRAVAPQIEEP